MLAGRGAVVTGGGRGIGAAVARALAAEIAENAPLAIGSVRATVRHGLAEQIARATDHELAEQQWLRATEDAEEGIRAVAERRPGNFKGQ